MYCVVLREAGEDGILSGKSAAYKKMFGVKARGQTGGGDGTAVRSQARKERRAQPSPH